VRPPRSSAADQPRSPSGWTRGRWRSPVSPTNWPTDARSCAVIWVISGRALDLLRIAWSLAHPPSLRPPGRLPEAQAEGPDQPAEVTKFYEVSETGSVRILPDATARASSANDPRICERHARRPQAHKNSMTWANVLPLLTGGQVVCSYSAWHKPHRVSTDLTPCTWSVPCVPDEQRSFGYVHSTTSEVVPIAHRRRLSGAALCRSRARLTRGVHRWVTPLSIAYSSLMTENGCESSIAIETGKPRTSLSCNINRALSAVVAIGRLLKPV